MSNRIQLTTIGRVSEGEYIVEVDDDSLSEAAVNENYAHDEQDWQHVIRTQGHADIGSVILGYHSGEQYRVDCDWSQTVWRLVDERGEPVRDEVER